MSTEETKRELEGTEEAPQDENFALLLESSEMSGQGEGLSPGERVRGVVSEITEEKVFVDLGGKMEGIIASKELKDEQGELIVKKGDSVEAYVVSNQDGQISLSQAASLQRGADKRAALEDAYKAKLPVEGTVVGRNKGGFDVQVMGTRAFCPVSQIEQGFVENLDQFLNKNYRFRITEFKEGGRSIVVSRAAILREESASKGEETLKNLKIGDIFEGEIRSIRDFGAFVDIGGVEGLIHVSEMSWGRIGHPKEVVSVGQKVRVKVIKVEGVPGKKLPRIGLSLRGLEDSPWERVGADFTEGETYEGSVVRLAPFGAFVELAPGLDGLVHVSEMAWGRRINHPQEVVSVGQKVRVTIQGIDRAQKRISLTMKSPEADPWNSVEERYAAGQQLTGRVEKVAPFGVFVALEDGVTALLPNSESDVRDPAREFPLGSEVTAVILEVDPGRRRLTLSRKALGQQEETGEVAMYRAEKQEFQGGRRRERKRGAAGEERGEKRGGEKGEREYQDFEDEDEGSGGFGSLGDLIRSKGKSRRR